MSLFIPKPFNCDDQHLINQLIEENPFALLISPQHQGVPMISHLPIHRYADGKLYGHLARANPHAQQDGPATLVFSGPHAYISPTWMNPANDDSKQTAAFNVPTWNYAAVHLTGSLAFIDDPDRTWAILKELSNIYEGSDGWQLPEQPPYRNMLKGLRAFEFHVNGVDAKFKFSQNKTPAVRTEIARNLQQCKETAAAQMMALFAGD